MFIPLVHGHLVRTLLLIEFFGCYYRCTLMLFQPFLQQFLKVMQITLQTSGKLSFLSGIYPKL